MRWTGGGSGIFCLFFLEKDGVLETKKVVGKCKTGGGTCRAGPRPDASTSDAKGRHRILRHSPHCPACQLPPTSQDPHPPPPRAPSSTLIDRRRAGGCHGRPDLTHLRRTLQKGDAASGTRPSASIPRPGPCGQDRTWLPALAPTGQLQLSALSFLVGSDLTSACPTLLRLRRRHRSLTSTSVLPPVADADHGLTLQKHRDRGHRPFFRLYARLSHPFEHAPGLRRLAPLEPRRDGFLRRTPGTASWRINTSATAAAIASTTSISPAPWALPLSGSRPMDPARRPGFAVIPPLDFPGPVVCQLVLHRRRRRLPRIALWLPQPCRARHLG